MSNLESGCAARAFFALLLVASIALNVAFVTGCKGVTQFISKSESDDGGSSQTRNGNGSPTYDATEDLRKIAERLGVEVQEDSASSIASAIQTKLYVEAGAKGFPEEMLSDQAMENVLDRLPEKQAEIVESYHRFLKTMEGKRFVIIP